MIAATFLRVGILLTCVASQAQSASQAWTRSDYANIFTAQAVARISATTNDGAQIALSCEPGRYIMTLQLPDPGPKAASISLRTGTPDSSGLSLPVTGSSGAKLYFKTDQDRLLSVLKLIDGANGRFSVEVGSLTKPFETEGLQVLRGEFEEACSIK